MLRLYLDQDSLHRGATRALERAGIDCVTALSVGMEQATDIEQLAFATQERRAIFTANRSDFAGIHAES